MGADSISPLRGRYLIFHLSDRAYAIPLRHVAEVVAIAELTPVPAAPTFLAGFLQVGDRLVTVISLRCLWGMPDRQPELYSPLVLLKAELQQVAFEVDRVSRIVEIADDDFVPISGGGSLNDCTVAIARVDGRTVILLSPARVLLEQEQRRIAALAEATQQRLRQMEAVTA